MAILNSGPSSTRKRVVVRKLNKQLVKGFVDPSRYLSPDGVEILDREGHLLNIPLREIKGIFFVRNFEGNPSRAERKIFRSRPRLAGLWVRMTFQDSEILEGLVPNNLLNIDPLGFHVTPPDVYSNNVKMFIPRTALSGIEVQGVISDGVLRRGSQKFLEASRQFGLFSPGDMPRKK